MDIDLEFVDSISASATVRLDLTAAPWAVQASTEFGMPEIRRAVAATLLTDGERYPAAAYGNRTIRLVAQVQGASGDDDATALQALHRELDRAGNVLRYRATGTSTPVYFRTFRCGPDAMIWDPVLRQVTVMIPAEPFALGLPETIGPVTVYNDPATPGADLNANPYFEADASSWTGQGGSVARSTAQFHEGAASLLLTPDGLSATAEARSELVATPQGSQYRLSAWLRSTVARAVNVNVNWYTAAAVFVSSSTISKALAAGTWTLYDETVTPPATATQARIVAGSMGGIPPAGNTVYIDEARLRTVGAGSACYADLTGIKGDVETPLRLTIPQAGGLVDADQMSVMAIRRRGAPSQMPLVLQAEAMTQGTDTSTQSAAEDASGTGNKWSKTTFATVSTSPVARLSISTWPTGNTADVRGRYRVLARVRTTVATDLIYAQLRWGLTFASAGNAEVSIGYNGAAGYSGWKIVDLGLISFPSGADPGVDGLTGAPLTARGQYLQIDVRRQSGTGQLDWDYLLFVPADDRLAVIDWGDIAVSGGSVVVDSTTETIYPVNSDGVVYGGGTPPSTTGWMMASPGVTNRLVWLRSAGPLGADSTTTTTSLTVGYLPRYLYARPVSS